MELSAKVSGVNLKGLEVNFLQVAPKEKFLGSATVGANNIVKFIYSAGMQQGGRQGGQPPSQILADQLTLS